jgi:membrane-anchored mycosin MYCP
VTQRTMLRAGAVLAAVLGLTATLTAAPAVTLAAPAAAAGTRPPSELPQPSAGCPGTSAVAAPVATPWAQQALALASVWRLTRGAGVTVAVVDSGVDANPQFGNRVTIGPDLAPSPTGLSPDADCVGHGTSVASIIAAAPTPGVSFTGVAPAAGILSVKITNSDTFPGSVAAQAIVTAVDDGAQVINLSLATVSTPALAAAVRFAQASDVVVVAAAGNDSPGGATGPFYPAAYPGVLSVGAVGQDGALAGFSDTRTPVSVTAPGVSVAAAYPGVFPRAYNPASNGTSFATAFVSGVAALVRAAHPGLDQAQVVARITATADGSAGPGTGHGLVNPVQAVTAVGAAAGSQAGVPTKAGAAQPRVTIDRPAHPDRRAAAIALPIAGGAAALAVLAVAAATVIPAGRRRHWRPGPP